MNEKYVKIYPNEIAFANEQSVFLDLDVGFRWVPRFLIKNGGDLHATKPHKPHPEFILVEEWFARKEQLV